MQALPLPHDQATFLRSGDQIARYHFTPDLRRPFLYPLIGPAGRSLTRMGHPHDPVSHSHHNSVWISHHDVGGVDFWGDRGEGRIVHERIERYEDADDMARLVAVNTWRAGDRVLLDERRAITVHALEGAECLLVIDVELTARERAVTLGKTPFGLVGVRMAKTIGVHDGGGMIRNSAGGVNEQEVLWKPARWVDYSGPITPDAAEGVTLLDHRANGNHPTVFHVRNDGWMGASLTFDGPRQLDPAEPLRLRYGLYVHGGVPTADALQQRWTEFCELPLN
jgi:hypothetical protein